MSVKTVTRTVTMPKLNPRSLFLIVLAACVLLLLAWFFGRFQPRKDEVVMLQSDLELLRSQVETSRTAQRNLPALRTRVAELQVEREQFLRALPQTAEYNRVLDEMRRNVSAAGAEMTTFAVQNGQAVAGLPAGVRPINVNLGVQGRFAEVFRALRSIETMGRFTTVGGLNMTLPEATSRDPELDSTLNLTVYTYDPAQAAGTATGAAPATAPGAPATDPAAAPAAAPASAPQGGTS